jgi:putative addiction module antidote
MNKPLKIVRIGNSRGVILPKEELDRLNLDVGDTIDFGATPDGLNLTTKGDDFNRQMAEARKIMKRYRNALSELAK